MINQARETHIEKIITALEHVQERPGMYFNGTISSLNDFIAGFELACGIFVDSELRSEAVSEVLMQYGLKDSNNISKKLADKGLVEQDIIEESIKISIAVYQTILKKLNDKKNSTI